MPQFVAVFLDHLAAAGGVDDDGLDAVLDDERPPGIDIAAHVGEPARAVVEMRAQRSTTSLARRDTRLDAGSVEHAHRGGVDLRPHRRLHAAAEQQHLAIVLSADSAALPRLATARSREPCS